MPAYLTVVEVLAIQARLLEEFGGATGVRDGGALESVLFRPQSGYYEDVIQEAAALFESLVQNHPFLDGNKRVAFAATDVVLYMNGFRLVVTAMEAHDFIVGSLEDGDLNFERIVVWLRMRVQDG